MEYALSRPFRGDREKSLDLAVTALGAIGFRLDERTGNSARLTGPGMNSTRESPLLGASRLDITARNGELALAAELGGVERMVRFVRIFPLALCGGLSLLFLAVFGVGFTFALGRQVPLGMLLVIGAIPLLNGVIWALIAPWMARGIQRRTCRGLETLLASMVTAGEATTANH